MVGSLHAPDEAILVTYELTLATAHALPIAASGVRTSATRNAAIHQQRHRALDRLCSIGGA